MLSNTVPTAKGGLPVIGHLVEFARAPLPLIAKGAADCGEHFQLRMPGRPFHVLASPKGHQAFFHAPENQLSARLAYRFTVPMYGNGVMYGAEPEVMDQQMALLHPLLNSKSMQSHTSAIVDEVEQYVRELGASGLVEMRTAMDKLTRRVFARCFLGADNALMLSPQFSDLFRGLMRGISSLSFMAPHFPSPANRTRDRSRRGLLDLLLPLIQARRRKTASSTDFLSLAMQARFEDGSALTDDQLVGILLALVSAAMHTTSSAAAWTGIALIEHPEELSAIRHEAQTVIGDSAPMLEQLRRLNRLECLLKEVERVYSPLALLMRVVQEDFEVDGRIIPRGASVIVSPWVSHRSPAIFKNPERFEPSRFGPGREEDKATRYALIGFGGGQHRCIGMAFANQLLKAVWTILPRHFDFELAGPSPKQYFDTTRNMITEALVRYKRRDAE